MTNEDHIDIFIEIDIIICIEMTTCGWDGGTVVVHLRGVAFMQNAFLFEWVDFCSLGKDREKEKKHEIVV